tara:strand:+ start:107 stop:523 length:417 start_codon:yes stop_codon:yes gene_type:complete
MKLRTNTKEYTKREQKYLLDSIQDWYFDGYKLSHVENFENLTDKERFNIVMAELRKHSDHKYNKRRIPNHQERLADHLQGMPSCIDIPTAYWRILEDVANLHNVKVKDMPEKLQDTIINNFHNRIAYALIKLETKLNK